MTEHTHSHPTCPELLDQRSEYIDGELDPAICVELEAHLAGCTNCRVMVDTVRRTITLYHAQPTPELPADVQSRLYKVLNLEQ